MNDRFSFKIIDAIENIYNDNTDVEVLVDGGKYVITFFTLTNIKTIMERYKSTGECLNGSYFRASDMIIVNDLNESTIHSALDAIIESGELMEHYQKVV